MACAAAVALATAEVVFPAVDGCKLGWGCETLAVSLVALDTLARVGCVPAPRSTPSDTWNVKEHRLGPTEKVSSSSPT
eukprot:2069966-Rhodomonas_salina.1